MRPPQSLAAHLRVAWLNRACEVHGYDEAIRLTAKRLERQGYRHAELNDAFVRTCLRHGNMDAVDAFVDGFVAAGHIQELTSFERLFGYLCSVDDLQRISRYRGIEARLGSVGQRLARYATVARFVELGAGEFLADTPPEGSANAVDDQLRIRALLDVGEPEQARERLLPTLLATGRDDPVAGMRERNARRLHSLLTMRDVVLDEYLACTQRLRACAARGKARAKAAARAVEPAARDAPEPPMFPRWIARELQAFRLRRAADRVAEKCGVDYSALLEGYARLISGRRQSPDWLVDRYISACIRSQRLDQAENLVARLIDRGARRRLVSAYQLFREVLKTGDRERVEIARRFLSLVEPRVARRAKLHELSMSGRFAELGLAVGESIDEVCGVDELSYAILALVNRERFDEARSLVRHSLFVPDRGHRERVERFLQVMRLAPLSRESDPVFDAFARTQLELVEKGGDFSPDEAWEWKCHIGRYFRVSGREAESARLYRRIDPTQAPLTQLKSLFDWMCAHEPWRNVAGFFGQESLRSVSEEARIRHGAALIECNRPEQALAALKQVGEGGIGTASVKARALIELGRCDEAYELLAGLLEADPNNEANWKLLLRCDSSANRSFSVACFRDHETSMQPDVRARVSYLIALETAEVELDWNCAISRLTENFSIKVASDLLSIAYIRERDDEFHRVLNLVIENAPNEWRADGERYITPTLTLLHSKGLTELATSLGARFQESRSDSRFALVKRLSSGDVIGALDVRGRRAARKVNDLLARQFPERQSDGVPMVCPERQLAGELYNSFMFSLVTHHEQPRTAVCDERLCELFKRSAPELDFVPKTPWRRMKNERSAFEGVPLRLCDFLDARSLRAVAGARLTPLPFRELYPHAVAAGHRRSGWLRPEDALRSRWTRALGRGGRKKLVGFSPSSTERSSLRDPHNVDLSLWGEVFALSDAVFVNLSAALDDDDIGYLSDAYGTEIIQPDADLYNDFSNLSALMSILDCAILPANSLMDFAASVGLRTFVPSPTGAMRNWIAPDTDRYVFSDQVEFLFCENGMTRPDLVTELVTRLSSFLADEPVGSIG